MSKVFSLLGSQQVSNAMLLHFVAYFLEIPTSADVSVYLSNMELRNSASEQKRNKEHEICCIALLKHLSLIPVYKSLRDISLTKL